MSKVATMLIRHNGKRFEIGEELPDKVLEALGEDHTAVGDSPRKKKTADAEKTAEKEAKAKAKAKAKADAKAAKEAAKKKKNGK